MTFKEKMEANGVTVAQLAIKSATKASTIRSYMYMDKPSKRCVAALDKIILEALTATNPHEVSKMEEGECPPPPPTNDLVVGKIVHIPINKRIRIVRLDDNREVHAFARADRFTKIGSRVELHGCESEWYVKQLA